VAVDLVCTAWTFRVHCLYALAGVATPDVLRDVAGLPRPEGEPANQGRSLVPAKMASKRGFMALLEYVMSQVAAIGDAEPVCCALAAPIEQTTSDQERSSRWSSCGWSHRLALPVDPCRPLSLQRP
jgi:hypothetical protein